MGKPRSHLLTTPGVVRLTRREREVLVLRRHTDADIAKALVVSTDTVKSHTRSVLRKLGFKGRGEIFRPRRALSA